MQNHQQQMKEELMSVRSTTTSTFQADVLQNDLPVLVDFWAPWCPPCRAVGPVLDQLAKEQASKVDVIKVNVDENPELAQKYGVTSIPAFRVFNNGDVAGSFVGAMPKEAFEDRLAPYLGSAVRN
ncbi:thioredoxin [Paenarthrobacter aromaticivorans]|uniref:thioredoxin n=1 Tax=Paenarthrobacter aromaticivorans TaxID=2849150 RepID=UPI003A81127E